MEIIVREKGGINIDKLNWLLYRSTLAVLLFYLI